MKIIKFTPIDERSQSIIDPPKPATKFIPDWYRKLDQHYIKNGVPFIPSTVDGGQNMGNLTAKRCSPFYDAMTAGYIYTLPCDLIFVDEKEYDRRVLWTVSYNPIGSHAKFQIGEMPLPDGYDELWKWNFPFHIDTPRGYSCLITHPNFKYDSPFITLDGIVDTDSHPLEVNFPFMMKSEFRGKIPKGTPIAQIIPFKRDDWKMEVGRYNHRYEYEKDRFHSMIEQSYRKMFWHKKKFK